MKKKLLKVAGKNVSRALGFFFDGCHKIYVAETPEDIALVKEYWGDTGCDKMHPMSALETTFKKTCALRFISWVNLYKPNTIVPQFANRVTFEYNTGKSVVRFCRSGLTIV